MPGSAASFLPALIARPAPARALRQMLFYLNRLPTNLLGGCTACGSAFGLLPSVIFQFGIGSTLMFQRALGPVDAGRRAAGRSAGAR